MPENFVWGSNGHTLAVEAGGRLEAGRSSRMRARERHTRTELGQAVRKQATAGAQIRL